MSTAVPFDTLAFAKELDGAGVPSGQAEAQAKALSGVLQKVEAVRAEELATKSDLKELELRMVIKTGAMILGGIGLLFGLMRTWPLPVQYVPPLATQEKQMPIPSTPTQPPVPQTR
ncbi:MAG: DUF1640 domain-containing protein [Magnetococcales bacterium]|nr:DUF1640 domain-containing protein [Magnetococcales bacterium]